MRRFYPFLVPLFFLFFLTGCKLTIETINAPDVAISNSVIPLTISCTATDISDGSLMNGVILQIPTGWSVLSAKVTTAPEPHGYLTENTGIASLYTAEAGHVIWAGTITSQSSGNEGSNVSFTFNVIPGNVGSTGQSQVYNMKAIVGAQRDSNWITDDPQNVFDFGNVIGEQYVKTITVTQVDDTTAPDPITISYINGGGTYVQISWSGYNEAGQGDVAAYRVYRSENDFSDVSGMVPIAQVPSGIFSYSDYSIIIDQGYYYAVTAVDVVGNVNPFVSTAYIVVNTPGSIGGNVYQSDGQTPVTGTTIYVEAYTGSSCGGSYSGETFVNSTTGEYTITGLPPGTYYLKTSSISNTHVNEWWASPQSVQNCADAQSITVAAGQAVTNKNFQLVPGATISGTIYQSDDVTLLTGKNVTVTAYTGSPCGSMTEVGSAFVNSTNGTYTIPPLFVGNALPAGTYYLQTSSYDYYYSEWWASPLSVRDCVGAQPIVVTEGQAVTNKNFQLVPGATISGTIYQSDGVTPLTGKNISVTAYTGSPCGSMTSAVSTNVESTNGTYTITLMFMGMPLPAGTYYLQTSSSENYYREWWAPPLSVQDCTGAQPIVVAEGQAAIGKDFQLDPGATISGTLYQSDGVTPLTGTNFAVTAYTGSPCDSKKEVTSATIYSNGTYTINRLPAGTYYLQASSSSSENYVDEWWASPLSVRDCTGAQPIVVAEGQAVTNKNFQLDTGATISGTLYQSDGVTPLTGKNINIAAYTGSPCSSPRIVKSANVDSTNGTYTITRLPAGTYYLQTSSLENYVDEWWASPLSVRDCVGAQPIVVAERQAVIGKDLQLEPGATISGTVYQSDGVTPLIGKIVSVYAYTGLPCGSLTSVGLTFANSTNGTYTINALPAGTYYLRTYSSSEYINEWWASPLSVWDCASAQSIVVTEGQAVANKDFQLEQFSGLSGDVNNDNVVDLTDAILALQVLTGMLPDNIIPAADVNGDEKIGMAEAIYAMQKAAGLR